MEKWFTIFRNLHDEIPNKVTEDEKKTKTKDKDTFSDLNNLKEPDNSNPISNIPEPDQNDDGEPVLPDMPKASQQDTLAATRNLSTPRMADLLSRMRDIEGDEDDAGYPEPETTNALVTTTTLPTIASQALDAGGFVVPTWHQVANLPGNMSRAIRTLGKQLFGSMTRTPTDEIYVIANLGGMGPNSTREVNAVADWIRNNGTDLGDGNIDFETSIPGYRADIRMFDAAGIRWLLVRDEFGQYIYVWPQQDSIDIENDTDRPRLT